MRQQNSKKRKLNAYQGSLHEIDMRSHASQPLPRHEVRPMYNYDSREARRGGERHYDPADRISDGDPDDEDDVEEMQANVQPRYT